MPKVYGDRPNFKKLEVAMRDVPNTVRSVIAQIDALLAGQRTAKEVAFLTKLREQAQLHHQASLDFYGKINESAD